MDRSRAVSSAALVCAAATGAAFSPAVGAPLLGWDDRANLVTNTAYRGFDAETVAWAFTTFHMGPWQPLSWLSWTLDHALWGADPRGFHGTNVLLQSVCAALLCLVAARLLPRALPQIAERPGLLAALSAFAALLWAAHPQRVESVAWATERRDVLSCAFLLGSVLAWLRHADGDASGVPWFRRGAWWAAFLLFAASLLSKATAMGFVLVLLLLDAFPLRRRTAAVLAEKVPFALAGAAVAAVAWFGQRATGATVDALPLGPRLVVAGATVLRHLWATLIPVGLRAHYQRPAPDEFLRADLVAAAVVGFALVIVVVALRRRMPAVAVALGAYLVLLAPVSGLALTGSHLFADRYSHQPTLGLGLLVAGALGALLLRDGAPVRPAAALLAAGAVVLTYGSAATALTATWRSPQALWGRVLSFEPENWVAHEQLAKEAYDRGDVATAEAHLDRSLRSLPGRRNATVFLALTRAQLGRFDDAERTITPLLAASPDDSGALRVRARVAAGRGETADALADLRRAVEADPSSVEALQEYGEALANAGRTTEAEVVARRIVERSPGSAAARVFLGSLVAARGDAAAAETLFREAVDLEPRSALALGWLGGHLAAQNRRAEAEPYLRRAEDVSRRIDAGR